MPASDEATRAETEPGSDGPRIRTFDGAGTELWGYVVTALMAGCCYLDDRGRVGMHGRALHLAPIPVSRFDAKTFASNRRRIVDSAHAQATNPRSESILDEFR